MHLASLVKFSLYSTDVLALSGRQKRACELPVAEFRFCAQLPEMANCHTGHSGVNAQLVVAGSPGRYRRNPGLASAVRWLMT